MAIITTDKTLAIERTINPSDAIFKFFLVLISFSFVRYKTSVLTKEKDWYLPSFLNFDLINQFTKVSRVDAKIIGNVFMRY